jgi:hypothetical protein
MDTSIERKHLQFAKYSEPGSDEPMKKESMNRRVLPQELHENPEEYHTYKLQLIIGKFCQNIFNNEFNNFSNLNILRFSTNKSKYVKYICIV